MTRPDPHPPAALAPLGTPALHPPHPPQSRGNAEYRWTPAKAMAFLDALAACGKVAAAARFVGMTRQSAYRLKARSALVAQAWPLALAAGRQRRQGYGSQGCALQGDSRQSDSLQGDGAGAAR